MDLEGGDSVENQELDNYLAMHIEKFYSLMSNYEANVLEIQTEAKQFRKDNQKLRNHLDSVLSENEKLKQQNEEETHVSLQNFKRDFMAVADTTIMNFQNQILMINKEKEMFENLWKSTAFVLEREVPFDSISKLKVEHSLQVKLLKEQIITVTSSYEKESKSNRFLKQNMKSILDEVKQLQIKNNELTEALEKVTADKRELEKLVENSIALNKEEMAKSVVSFQKLQETIKVADEALAEVETLSNEKRQIEAEYKFLVETISAVIQAECDKVERVFDEMKQEHQREIVVSDAEIEKLKQSCKLEEARKLSALERVKAFEKKLSHSSKMKSHLEQDLATVMKTVETTEAKVREIKAVFSEEKRLNEFYKLETEKLKKIIENSRHNKARYKKLITKVTLQLEEKINELMEENNRLKGSSR